MELTTSLILEISAAFLLSILAILFSLKASINSIVYILIVLIPFQLIETSIGTLNVALAYFVTVAMYIRRRLFFVPLNASILFLLFCYFLSWSQVHPAQNMSHMFYMISFVSAILVFIITYNFLIKTDKYGQFINILHTLNVLVVLYNALQMYAGENNTFSIGGIVEFSIVSARTGGDMRLAGPFGYTMPGLIAEYLVISILLCIYDIVFCKKPSKKFFLSLLIFANTGCLIATGNRGGIIGLIIFFMILVFILRKPLGTVRILKIGVFGSLILVAMSIFIIKFTSYDRLFDRLAGTEIENGVPDTRAYTWPAAIEMFKEKPILGHGPRLRLQDDDEIIYPDHTVIEPPHNLYLYVLCTTGALGLLGFALLFLAISISTAGAARSDTRDEFLNYWPKFGLILIAYILFDQIKIEFLRYTSVDYWQYLFMLLGVILGLSHKKEHAVKMERNNHKIN